MTMSNIARRTIDTRFVMFNDAAFCSTMQVEHVPPHYLFTSRHRGCRLDRIIPCRYGVFDASAASIALGSNQP